MSVFYLNDLAVKVFQKIYKTKRQDTNLLPGFFKVDIPLLMYQYRRYVMYAFSFFFLAVLIGVIAAANDDSFMRLILGDSYVIRFLVINRIIEVVLWASHLKI